MTERLAGKVVLVTGGTSGIGEAIARRAEVGRALADELRANGGRALFVPTDVRVEADAQALVAAAVAEFGQCGEQRGHGDPSGPGAALPIDGGATAQ
ncbi:hypothetical protein ACFOWZ_38345 [Lentzea rhizosphaerae]|uniref:Short chain dehydrogenase n=1 Tax=Lentzea rhizosphaerae TaxID=2041025 RepID=A0ABV8C5V6_9PSEU